MVNMLVMFHQIKAPIASKGRKAAAIANQPAASRLLSVQLNNENSPGRKIKLPFKLKYVFKHHLTSQQRTTFPFVVVKSLINTSDTSSPWPEYTHLNRLRKLVSCIFAFFLKVSVAGWMCLTQSVSELSVFLPSLSYHFSFRRCTVIVPSVQLLQYFLNWYLLTVQFFVFHMRCSPGVSGAGWCRYELAICWRKSICDAYW